MSRAIPIGIALLLVGATLGEGGGSVDALAAWHAGLVLLLVLAAASPSSRWRLDPAVAGWGLAFVAAVAVGATLAPYLYAAWLTLWELLLAALFLALAAARGPALLRQVVDPLRAAVVAHAVAAAIQAFGGAGRPASTFLNPNHLGGWAAAVLLLGLGAAGEERGAGRRAWALGAASGAALALALSGSRGAWLGAAVGGVWLARGALPRLGRRGRIALAFAALAVVALGTWSQRERLRESDPFRYTRVEIWSASARMALDRPWLGSGPGQFETLARRYAFPDGNGPLEYDRGFTVPHSDLLRLPAELGLPAAALALLGLAALVRVARRRLRAAESPWTAGHGAAAALLAVGVQGLVDDPSGWPALTLLALTCAGALASVPGPASRGVSRVATLAGAGALLLVWAVGDVGPWRAHRAVPWDVPAGGEELGRGLERARRLCPQRADLHRLAVEQRVAAGVPTGRDPRAYAAAREDLETSIRLDPREFTHRWALARLEGGAARTLFSDAATRERAERRFDEAIERAPFDVRVRIDAGALALAEGEPARARRRAEQALALEPNAVPALLLLAEARAAVDPADPEIAGLLARAREIVAAHRDRDLEGYARELLRADPARLGRLERRARERREAAP